MEVDGIPYRETGYFSSLICDYLEQRQALSPFYNRYPDLDRFGEQILEKQGNFPPSHRRALVESLQAQYEGFPMGEATQANIRSLSQANTFTVVTGHQLNLFTGPLYFLYKIVTTIKLAKKLKETHPEKEFVPLYWMATEDHDFEEINYFKLHGKKLLWNRKASGAVGRLDTGGLEALFGLFAAELGNSTRADVLKDLFKRAYLDHGDLAAASRFLVNELFGDQGLVILDGDDARLKALLVPHMEKDILEQIPYREVTRTLEALRKVSPDYKIQVNPREINYFYLGEDMRERIVKKNGGFQVLNTTIRFSPEEMAKEIRENPQRFSPNVIARPLYQETVLPNLCYIGGGGELAYWLELQGYFGAMDVTFPMLLLRNSALIITKKQAKQAERLQLAPSHLFMEQPRLINRKIREISNIDIDFSPQKKLLEKQFKELLTLAEQTDKSFLGAVKAQETKQKKGLDHLEKRLLLAQKKKLREHVIRLTDLQNELFPNGSLQERQLNFSELFLEFGQGLIPRLLEVLDPFSQQFCILKGQ